MIDSQNSPKEDKKVTVISCFGLRKKFIMKPPGDEAGPPPEELEMIALPLMEENREESRRKKNPPMKQRRVENKYAPGNGTMLNKLQRSRLGPLKPRGVHRSQIVSHPYSELNSMTGLFNPPQQSSYRDFSPRQTDVMLGNIEAESSFLSQPSIVSKMAPVKQLNSGINVSVMVIIFTVIGRDEFL